MDKKMMEEETADEQAGFRSGIVTRNQSQHLYLNIPEMPNHFPLSYRLLFEGIRLRLPSALAYDERNVFPRSSYQSRVRRCTGD